MVYWEIQGKINRKVGQLSLEQASRAWITRALVPMQWSMLFHVQVLKMITLPLIYGER